MTGACDGILGNCQCRGIGTAICSDLNQNAIGKRHVFTKKQLDIDIRSGGCYILIPVCVGVVVNGIILQTTSGFAVSVFSINSKRVSGAAAGYIIRITGVGAHGKPKGSSLRCKGKRTVVLWYYDFIVSSKSRRFNRSWL